MEMYRSYKCANNCKECEDIDFLMNELRNAKYHLDYCRTTYKENWEDYKKLSDLLTWDYKKMKSSESIYIILCDIEKVLMNSTRNLDGIIETKHNIRRIFETLQNIRNQITHTHPFLNEYYDYDDYAQKHHIKSINDYRTTGLIEKINWARLMNYYVTCTDAFETLETLWMESILINEQRVYDWIKIQYKDEKILGHFELLQNIEKHTKILNGKYNNIEKIKKQIKDINNKVIESNRQFTIEEIQQIENYNNEIKHIEDFNNDTKLLDEMEYKWNDIQKNEYNTNQAKNNDQILKEKQRLDNINRNRLNNIQSKNDQLLNKKQSRNNEHDDDDDINNDEIPNWAKKPEKRRKK